MDPNSDDSVDPAGSGKATMTHRKRKKVKKYYVFKCWMFSVGWL
jgi:hypothetical protein